MKDCNGEVSCNKCRKKCKDYIEYVKEKQSINMLQGEDRQPLHRKKNGALGRR